MFVKVINELIIILFTMDFYSNKMLASFFGGPMFKLRVSEPVPATCLYKRKSSEVPIFPSPLQHIHTLVLWYLPSQSWGQRKQGLTQMFLDIYIYTGWKRNWLWQLPECKIIIWKPRNRLNGISDCKESSSMYQQLKGKPNKCIEQ